MGMLQGLLDPLGLFPMISKLFKGGDASTMSDLGKSELNNVGTFSDPGTTPGADGASGAPPTSYSANQDQSQAAAGYADAARKAAEQAEIVKDRQRQRDADDAAHNTGVKDVPKQDDEKTKGTNTLPHHNKVVPQDDDKPSGAPGEQHVQSSGASTGVIQIQGQARPTALVTLVEQRAQSSSADTGVTQTKEQDQTKPAGTTPGEQRAQSSSAATAGVQTLAQAQAKAAEARAKEVEVIRTVVANFQVFDSLDVVGGDGKFDPGNLQNLAHNSKYSDRIQKAAQYLLDHPEVMEKMAVISTGGNDQVNIMGISQYLKKLIDEQDKEIKTLPPPSSGTETPPGSGAPSGQDPITGGPAGGSTPVEPPNQPQAKTLDEALANIGNSMDAKEKALIAVLNSSTALAGDKAKAQQDLMKVTQQFQQMYALINQLASAFHDMSMSSINHIK